MQVENRSFEKVSLFKYLGIILTNDNDINVRYQTKKR